VRECRHANAGGIPYHRQPKYDEFQSFLEPDATPLTNVGYRCFSPGTIAVAAPPAQPRLGNEYAAAIISSSAAVKLHRAIARDFEKC